MKTAKLFLVILLFTSLQCKKPTSERPLQVYAAASTAGLAEDLIRIYESQTGKKALLNVASSGKLARQIEEGGEADVFLSASREWVEFLKEKNLTLEVFPVMANRIVVIAPAGYQENSITLKNLQSFWPKGKVAMADPAHAPAGKYGKAFLEYLDVYKDLENRMIVTLNVSAALHLVELEECQTGIVYRTDAKQSDKVKIIAEAPQKSHPPIRYWGAIVSSNGEAKTFMNLLTSKEGRKLIKAHGFLIVSE